MELEVSQKDIEERIFQFQGNQVMVDRDLAEMYSVETKVLNQAVKRNIERFPKSFRFQLTDAERNELVTNCDRFKNLKHSSSNPFVFTEQGVAMLSAVLRSDVAIKVSIQIIDAFVDMRKHYNKSLLIDNRLKAIETKQLQTDLKFDEVFKALESKTLKNDEGIFFNGQIFDAYALISKILRTANTSIILIDNYVDDTVLTLLSKRNEGVTATIYTHTISQQLKLDIEKHNQQYPRIAVKNLKTAHDRFLILDEKELYHIGASLKDAGKKWFAFSKMDSLCEEILNKL